MSATWKTTAAALVALLSMPSMGRAVDDSSTMGMMESCKRDADGMPDDNMTALSAYNSGIWGRYTKVL